MYFSILFSQLERRVRPFVIRLPVFWYFCHHFLRELIDTSDQSVTMSESFFFRIEPIMLQIIFAEIMLAKSNDGKVRVRCLGQQYFCIKEWV
jgi:hypothetical protein